MGSQWQYWIITTIIITGIGIIGFFLKRNFNRQDKVEEDVRRLNDLKASRAELDKVTMDICKIKEDFLTKQDFYREQQKTERQLARIMDILLELKEAQKHGS